MRIAIVTDDFSPRTRGGAGMIATALAEGLALRGNKVIVLTADQPKAKYRVGKIDVRSFSSPRSVSTRAVPPLRNPDARGFVDRCLEEFSPDVVSVHNVSNRLSWSAVEAAASHAPVVFTAHDAMSVIRGKLATKQYRDSKDVHVSLLDRIMAGKTAFRPWREYFIRQIMRRNIKTVVSVSDELARALRSNGIQNTIRTIHNGVSEVVVSSSAVKSSRKKHSINDELVVLFAGRTSKLKGFDAAVDIVREMRKKRDTLLLVCGNKEENIDSWIRWTGWIDPKDMAAAYEIADVVIVPSLYLDPFPTVNIEALSHGKIIAATKYGGSPEAVSGAGLIIDPRDVGKSASQILRVIESSTKKRKLEASARKRYLERFTRERMIADYETVLQSVTRARD